MFVHGVLSRRGKRGERPAVKGIFQRDDLVSARAVFILGILSRRFDCAFVRLGARIGKENFFCARLFA